MEYVEGQPVKGPLPLDQGLDLAVQILDALDAAHRKGITHRDLKPGNILVSKTGGVKVLDFGLAKFEWALAVNAETETKPLTDEGTILGTPQYMSPEQIEGISGAGAFACPCFTDPPRSACPAAGPARAIPAYRLR